MEEDGRRPVNMSDWKLVPVEPTEEMFEAAKDNRSAQPPGTLPGSAMRQMYEAMLAAAPPPPAPILPAPTFQGAFDTSRTPINGILQLETQLSERDIKALSDYIGRITPPAQEVEPAVHYFGFENRTFVYTRFKDEAEGHRKRIEREGGLEQKLYTRPANDDLRKAAEEAFDVLTDYHASECRISEVVKMLHAALERK